MRPSSWSNARRGVMGRGIYPEGKCRGRAQPRWRVLEGVRGNKENPRFSAMDEFVSPIGDYIRFVIQIMWETGRNADLQVPHLSDRSAGENHGGDTRNLQKALQFDARRQDRERDRLLRPEED